jgi:hypothetical protein
VTKSKKWKGLLPQGRLALDRVAGRGECDEDMDIGSIFIAGMRPAGCDEDWMSSIS